MGYEVEGFHFFLFNVRYNHCGARHEFFLIIFGKIVRTNLVSFCLMYFCHPLRIHIHIFLCLSMSLELWVICSLLQLIIFGTVGLYCVLVVIVQKISFQSKTLINICRYTRTNNTHTRQINQMSNARVVIC